MDGKRSQNPLSINTAFRLSIANPNLVCHARTGAITVVLCSRSCAYCASDKHILVLLITREEVCQWPRDMFMHTMMAWKGEENKRGEEAS